MQRRDDYILFYLKAQEIFRVPDFIYVNNLTVSCRQQKRMKNKYYIDSSFVKTKHMYIAFLVPWKSYSGLNLFAGPDQTD